MEKLLDFQNKEDQQLLLTLPRVKSWDFPYLYQCQGFWSTSMFLRGIISLQKHFQAKYTDIILATFPKSVYGINQFSILEDLHTPRTLATHLPYASLPPFIISSGCRIVYLCRTPLDQFISHWHFAPKIQDQEMTEPILLDDAFEMLCQGVQCYGPIWEHVLGYWKASLEKPDKILFLKYEDLQEDIISCLKKLANFLGFPFTDEEETRGVIEEISKFSSFDNMKNWKQGGRLDKSFKSKRIEKVMEEKLGESSGLMTFKFNQLSSSQRDIE
ncbi:hypothetical protein ACOSQ4_031952 [Xanthoceras sorbifolium]